MGSSAKQQRFGLRPEGAGQQGAAIEAVADAGAAAGEHLDQVHGAAYQRVGAILQGPLQEVQRLVGIPGLPGLPHRPSGGAVALLAHPGLLAGGLALEVLLHHGQQPLQLRLQAAAGVAAMNPVAHQFGGQPGALVA